MNKRAHTKVITVKNLKIGGKSPISIQSMTNTNSDDFTSTYIQVKKLIDAGADLVRISTPTLSSVKVASKIQKKVHIPICADIHFDYKIALESIYSGLPKIRINPGTLGTDEQYKQVIKEAKKNKTVIRIGVNSGSVHRKYAHLSLIKSLIKTMEYYVSIAENLNFKNLILSAKTTTVQDSIEINTILSKKYVYPLHTGITEAGMYEQAIAKSYTGLGYLLLNGIGDTIRISITGDPVQEIHTARRLLGSLELRKEPSIISCPTCGRTQVKNLDTYAFEVESLLFKYNKPITFAIMGCIVNGPGECKLSDLGVILNKNTFILYKKGKKIGIHLLSNFKRIVEKEIKQYSL